VQLPPGLSRRKFHWPRFRFGWTHNEQRAGLAIRFILPAMGHLPLKDQAVARLKFVGPVVHDVGQSTFKAVDDVVAGVGDAVLAAIGPGF